MGASAAPVAGGRTDVDSAATAARSETPQASAAPSSTQRSTAAPRDVRKRTSPWAKSSEARMGRPRRAGRRGEWRGGEGERREGWRRAAGWKAGGWRLAAGDRGKDRAECLARKDGDRRPQASSPGDDRLGGARQEERRSSARQGDAGVHHRRLGGWLQGVPGAEEPEGGGARQPDRQRH